MNESVETYPSKTKMAVILVTATTVAGVGAAKLLGRWVDKATTDDAQLETPKQ